MKPHLVALAATLVAAAGLTAQEPAEIYTNPGVPVREALERLNLRMAWRVYLPSVGRKDGIHSVLLLEDQILALTRHGVTVALDPRTGAVLWRTFVGEPFGVTRALEADGQFAYVVNLGKQYILRRKTGEPAPAGPTPIGHSGLIGLGEAPTAWLADTVYTVRTDNSLTAEAVEGGFLLWRFALPGRVLRRQYVTTRNVFVAPEGAGLHRIDRVSGMLEWSNPEATRFLAANPKFVYATDRTGRLLVLDYARGTRLSDFDTRDFVVPLGNEVSDRIYLAAHNGLLVCLHDRDYPTPLRNQAWEAPVPAPRKTEPGEKPEEKPPEKAPAPPEKGPTKDR